MKKLWIFIILAAASFSYADDFIIDEPASSGSSSQSGNFQPPQPQAPAPIPQQAYQPRTGRYMPFIGSVPTPDNLNRGQCNIEFAMYDNGGVNARVLVGIFDILSIGMSENFDGLIGADGVNVNIPGVYAKLTILNNNAPFNWAVGFDSFAYGRNGSFFNTNSTPSTIYGFYSTMGWHYSLFGGKDTFAFGVRAPLLPSEFRDWTNISVFMGTTASVSSFLLLGMTLENIYFTGDRAKQILPSLSISLLPSSQFKLSVILQYEFYTGLLNRIFSLGYESSF